MNHIKLYCGSSEKHLFCRWLDDPLNCTLSWFLFTFILVSFRKFCIWLYTWFICMTFEIKYFQKLSEWEKIQNKSQQWRISTKLSLETIQLIFCNKWTSREKKKKGFCVDKPWLSLWQLLWLWEQWAVLKPSFGN